jgi:hypothetical protein
MSSKRKGLLFCLLLIALGTIRCQLNPVSLTATPFPTLSLSQLECVKQTFGDFNIVGSRERDVDGDGDLELIVIYMADKNFCHLAVVENASSQCKVTCNKKLTYATLKGRERLPIVLREVEVVEVTGDGEPELHIWLDVGEVRDEPPEYHAILTSVDDSCQHILGSTGIALSRSRSLFEFRDAPSGDARDIYIENYNPTSRETRYTIMRWDGSKFTPIDWGVIDVATTSLWTKAGCVAALLAPEVIGAGIVTVLVTRWRRSRRARSDPYDTIDPRQRCQQEVFWIVFTFVIVLLFIVSTCMVPVVIGPLFL